MRVLFALAILLTCGFCQGADLEQKNLENNLIDNPSLRYRCPVKDKFLNRANSFDSYRDIGSWQDCGKYIFWKRFFIFFPGLICARTQGSNVNDFCSFWSFICETCFLYPAHCCTISISISERSSDWAINYYPAGADKDPMDISGAFSGERRCLE